MAEWEKFDSGTAEHDHGNESLGRVKSESTMADHADLAVHSFHGSIRETPLEEAADPQPVSMKGLSESLERGQLRSSRPGEPVAEFTFGASNARTGKHSLEGFLQQVGSVETFVGLLHAGQLGLLLPGEVPGIFQ